VIKRIFKILLIVVLVILGLLLGAKWILKEAFGPKYRTVEIELNNDRKLVCEETYNADLAAVFYDVDFILKDKNKEDINLGQASFSNENWDKKIKLVESGDWIILPIDQGAYSKVLMSNDRLKILKDTTFSPLELRYDNVWKAKYDEIPAWVYTGQSKIDSIIENTFYVNYEYRIGLYEPFEFYNQTIEYEMDEWTGEFVTKTIFERIKK
jgi:hypothetical protein